MTHDVRVKLADGEASLHNLRAHLSAVGRDTPTLTGTVELEKERCAPKDFSDHLFYELAEQCPNCQAFPDRDETWRC